MDSANPFMALTGAIVCRAVALHVEETKEFKVRTYGECLKILSCIGICLLPSTGMWGVSK
jgi:hypothetical protein